MDEVERVVNETVLEVARQRGFVGDAVAPGQQLVRDLGLKSLDIARLVALLEMELGADPFASLVAITDIRAVGDLVAAYRRAIEGIATDHSE